jgi:glyoxylase-like metal-dependent hydrolase (beta-lactamase superfamily II)
MRGCAVVALVLGLAWPAAAQGQSARSVIDDVSKAMGGDSLQTLEYTASGFDFFLGQNFSPNAPWPKFIAKSYKRAIDFRAPSLQTTRVRLQGENPPRGGGNQPLIGEQTQTQSIIINDSTPWVQQLELWMTPHGFLKAAAANNATLSTQTKEGKQYRVLTFKGRNGADVHGYVNDQRMVERVETYIDNTMLGDMPWNAIYTDYRDYGGVKFPTRIVHTQGPHPTFDLTVSEVKPNAPVTIEAGRGGGPGGGQGQGAGGGAAPGETPTQKLADGIYLILGGTAAVAVDFRDSIVIIESPQNEARSIAVMDAAKKLIPGKPIGYLVNTHHHFDHAGGIRTYVAEGATIVTHEVNRAFLQQVFTTPRRLNPDRLSQSPRPPKIETMTEKKVMTDGNHVIELHHMQGSTHNAGLIVAYFPKEKFLVEADAFNPPPQPLTQPPANISPYTTNMVENLERLKLDVERIVPVHYPADGRVVSKVELMRAVGK